MAFSELNVHRALQPWRTAGLSLWLCADEAQARAVRSPAAVQPAPQAVTGTATSRAPFTTPTAARPVPSGTMQAGAQASPAPQISQRQAPARSPQTSQTSPISQTTPSSQPVLSQQDALLAGCIRPEAAWPEPWRALLARSPQAVGGRRARIVWSYPALRDDYGGRADPARRAMLQQLLRDLALPSGSHGFWPQTPPPYDSPQAAEADPVFFHSGIEALNPLVVVLFGAPSPALHLPALMHLVPDMVRGRTFVRVQDVDTLAAPFTAGNAQSGRPPHLGLVQFLKSQLGALFIS